MPHSLVHIYILTNDQALFKYEIMYFLLGVKLGYAKPKEINKNPRLHVAVSRLELSGMPEN